jgi:hypothetical protein
MHSCSVLINCGCCLGAAIAVFPVELQRADAMVTVNALEDAAVLDAGIGVMSHSFHSSLISRNPVRTMVTAFFPSIGLHSGCRE